MSAAQLLDFLEKIQDHLMACRCNTNSFTLLCELQDHHRASIRLTRSRRSLDPEYGGLHLRGDADRPFQHIFTLFQQSPLVRLRQPWRALHEEVLCGAI